MEHHLLTYERRLILFDTGCLLNKLLNLGVADRESKWFKDYLPDRTQVVKFQGVSSDPDGVTMGVPKGSILGPLLFILHVNDLPDADTMLFYSAKQASVIEEKLNKHLASVGQWFHENIFFFNVAKTEAMIFGTVSSLSYVDLFHYNKWFSN